MNSFSIFLFFVAITAGLISAQTTYTFKIGYDMHETHYGGEGAVPGTVSFHFDSANRSHNIIRYDHSVYGANGEPVTITEFENYTAKNVFKICPGMCEGLILTKNPERWWYNKTSDTLDETDTFQGYDGRTYYRYNRKMERQSGIKALYLLKNLLANGNDVVIPQSQDYLPAKIIFQDDKEIILKQSTFQSIPLTDASFNMPTGVSCVAKKCRSYLDIVFVLDESGSIDKDEFGIIKTFALALVGNLTIGLDAASIGVVLFSTESRIAFHITHVNVDGQIQDIAKEKGKTYQGKGLANAYKLLTEDNFRKQHFGRPTQFVIALTDGEDYDYTDIKNQANKLKNYGAFLIEVGVAIEEKYANKLRKYVSTLDGEPGYFDVKNFNALLTKINDLVDPICDNSNSTMCDPKCNGFCGCTMSCYCPTCTSTGTRCEINKCEIFGNTTRGCERNYTLPHFDKCYDYNCTEEDGWIPTPRTCDPNKKTCEEQVCLDDDVVCYESMKMDTRCTDLPDLCHNPICDPTNPNADNVTGCVYENTCTGESDSRITYPDGNKGCINYICINATCIVEDACNSEGGIDECMAMQCNKKTNKCEIVGETVVNCSSDNECPIKDNCTVPKCTDGVCSYDTKDGKSLPTCNGCYKAMCNNETGEFELYYRGCGNKDKCIEEICVNGTGKCTYQFIYPYKPCFTVECDSETGEGRGYVEKNCSNPEIENGTCIRFRCNEEFDRCESYIENAEIACPNDNPKCVIANCSGQGAKCQYTEVIAPGVTQCKLSRCDPETGIASLYDKCDDGRICTVDSCDYDGICTNRYHYCEYMPRENLSSCFFWGCSENRKNGCYQKIYDNAYFDECGYCIGPYDDEKQPDKKKLRECKKALTWEEKAAAISGGVAGAIIAACVIAAIGVSVGGTLLTRELIKRARAAADSGAVENPMYQDNGREMSNPAFEGEDMDG